MGLLGYFFYVLKWWLVSDGAWKGFIACNALMSNLQSPMSHIKYNLSYWSLLVNSPSRCHLHLSSPPGDGCQGSRLSFEGIPNNNGSGFLAAGQSFSSEALPAQGDLCMFKGASSRHQKEAWTWSPLPVVFSLQKKVIAWRGSRLHPLSGNALGSSINRGLD